MSNAVIMVIMLSNATYLYVWNVLMIKSIMIITIVQIKILIIKKPNLPTTPRKIKTVSPTREMKDDLIVEIKLKRVKHLVIIKVNQVVVVVVEAEDVVDHVEVVVEEEVEAEVVNK